MHIVLGKQKSVRQFIWSILLVGIVPIVFMSGCGGNSDLADVRGVVTLDGEPLSNAFILYTPEAEGAPSFGKTGTDGSYRMKFSDTQNGAFIGSNFVTIRTGDVKADNTGSIPETVPAVYNDETTLKASVVQGKNTFDFDLKSDAGSINHVETDDDESDDDES